MDEEIIFFQVPEDKLEEYKDWLEACPVQWDVVESTIS